MRVHPNIKAIFQKDTRLWLVYLIMLPLVLNTLNTPNTDFSVIIATVRDWLAGRTQLYDNFHVYFNYTPWSLLIWLPFSVLPQPVAQLLFSAISLGLLIFVTWYLTKPTPWWMIALSLTTIYTGMLIKQGQWDSIVLASLLLGWIGYQHENPWLFGIAVAGMTTKITNIIFPLLLLLFAIRTWPKRKLFTALIIPLLAVGLSFLISGWDWPIRYLKLLKATYLYFQSYQVVTLFSKTVYLISYRLIQPPVGAISVLLLTLISLYILYRLVHRRVNIDSLYLTMVLNLVISPYITFHHIIYLAPLQAQLLKTHRSSGLILLGTAVVDLLFLWLGIGLIIYPLVAILILIIILLVGLHRGEAMEGDKPTLGYLSS